MNCCDDYGQCTQGHNCPARMAHVNRECHEPQDVDAGYVLTPFGICCAVFLSVVLGLALGAMLRFF